MKFDRKPGFPGHDAMRTKAEQAFKDDYRGRDDENIPSPTSRDREKVLPYKKGGHVKQGQVKVQLNIPHKMKMQKPMVNKSVTEYKKGGPVKGKKMYGGGLMETLGTKPMPSPAYNMPRKAVSQNMKKGGKPKKMMFGGDVLQGMKSLGDSVRSAPGSEFGPRMAPAVMPKQSPATMKKGGKMCAKGGKPMAIGGVAKIRHKEATASGMPIKLKKTGKTTRS